MTAVFPYSCLRLSTAFLLLVDLQRWPVLLVVLVVTSLGSPKSWVTSESSIRACFPQTTPASQTSKPDSNPEPTTTRQLIWPLLDLPASDDSSRP